MISIYFCVFLRKRFYRSVKKAVFYVFGFVNVIVFGENTQNANEKQRFVRKKDCLF